jgi:hypothetical protein
MKIHEYQAKELLRAAGVPVPRGYAAFTVREAQEAAQKLGGAVWVVKAQIHAGGRGKGGGVKLARALPDVQILATQILGMQLKTPQTSAEGQKVRRLLVEEGADIKKEFYVAALTDRATQKVAMMASSEGGMDIEEVAHNTPEKILKVFIDPLVGLTDDQALELAAGIGVPIASQAKAVDVLKKLYTCYMDTDASLPCFAILRSSLTAISTKKTQPRSKPANLTSATSAWTATLVAWSTVLAWQWPRWTPSSCLAASPPTSWMWVAVPPPKRLPRPSRSCSPTRTSRASW